jgi:hypothetical protein
MTEEVVAEPLTMEQALLVQCLLVLPAAVAAAEPSMTEEALV